MHPDLAHARGGRGAAEHLARPFRGDAQAFVRGGGIGSCVFQRPAVVPGATDGDCQCCP